MRSLLYATATAAIVCAAPALATSQEVEVGATRTLSAGGTIRQVIVDVPGVVDAELQGNRRLQVRGQKPGRANVTLVSSAGRSQHAIEVVEAGTIEAGELRRRLNETPGAQGVAVERKGGQFVLSGRVADLATYSRVTALAEGWPGARSPTGCRSPAIRWSRSTCALWRCRTRR